MIIETLSREQADAVDDALGDYLGVLRFYGADPALFRDFETALLGYRDFADKIAGDSLRNITRVLFPILAAAEEGLELEFPGGVVFTDVACGNDGSVSGTVVDENGIGRLRLEWLDPVHGNAVSRFEELTVKVRSLQSADRIATASAVADLKWVAGDPNTMISSGRLRIQNFRSFIDAMDVLRSAIGDEILELTNEADRRDLRTPSFEDVDKAAVRELVRLDGGLPGRLALHAFSSVIERRGGPLLTMLADQADLIASWLEAQDCVWGGASLTSNNRDNVMYAVKPEATGKPALFYNARNHGGAYTAFLIWKDEEGGAASIAAMKGGKHIFQTVGAFQAGEILNAPTVSVDLKTGAHNLEDAIDSSIMDIALFHVQSVMEDLDLIERGEMVIEDCFRRVDDFEFFVEANSNFYHDQDILDELASAGSRPA